MREVDRVLEDCRLVLRRCIPTDMAWRLLVVGSTAIGEATLTDSDGIVTWRSDVELYLESPDRRLGDILRKANRELGSVEGPKVEISGASPDRIERFETRLWTVDIGNGGRRLDGNGDDWAEPFAKFAGKNPEPLDAMVLLANRSADQIGPDRDGDYARAKFVLDAYSASLILAGFYRTGVLARLKLSVEAPIRKACQNQGLDEFLLDVLPLVARWKLTAEPGLAERIRSWSDQIDYALRRSVPRLLDAATGLPRGSALSSLRHWITSRSPRELSRDWLRSLAADLMGTLQLGAQWNVGPLWQARLDALEAFLGRAPACDAMEAHRHWSKFAKGV